MLSSSTWAVHTYSLIRSMGYLLRTCVGFAILPLQVVSATGQSARTDDSPSVVPMVSLGGVEDQRNRTLQLLGREATAGYLIRSPSSLVFGRGEASRGDGFFFIAPEARVVYNSSLPFSINQGALWAGRGLNAQLLAGIRAEYGPLRLILAPQLLHSQNDDFQHLLPDDWGSAEWESFIPPWHTGAHALDLPLRFGEGPQTRLNLGQSTLAIAFRGVEAGVSTENHWWGPGIRNAIVMSSNAGGFPHMFLRTGAPVETRLGSFEGRWMVGGLQESGFWHGVDGSGRRGSDLRALSAAAATFTPAREPSLTVGVARVVYELAGDLAGVAGRGAHVFTRWDHDRHAEEPARSEQILSFFGRYVFPQAGLELYTEWARHELPTSFRDVLLAPEHSQGYTLGLQWAGELRAGRALRLQAEHTYLEQSPTYRARPVGSFYAGDVVPQGYTHRGEVIGAAIGPGASGQWLAADFLTPRFAVGAFTGRIRWANDAYYDKPGGHNRYLAHDVSFFGGLRSTRHGGSARVSAEWTLARRFNFLFQNPALDWNMRDMGVNVWNHTLQLSVTPIRPVGASPVHPLRPLPPVPEAPVP